MRLFISYARVDKPYCIQIAETLDAHEVWYDDRLYAGQQWWKEILRRLDWCEGFVYLLSPESVNSEYCQKEFAIAKKNNRLIFPILIHGETELLDELKEIQYADLSDGLTPEAVKTLLNSIHQSELDAQRDKAEVVTPVMESVLDTLDTNEVEVFSSFESVDLMTTLAKAADAMDAGNYDDAVYLLKQVQSSEQTLRFINLSELLDDAESALERQTMLREAEREYKPIAELIKRRATRKVGCAAFEKFRSLYPEYDPDDLKKYCNTVQPENTLNLPRLEWVAIESGMLQPIKTETSHKNGSNEMPIHIEKFWISKFPVTNAQYQVFVDDSDGYANPQWWQYSGDAAKWRAANPESKPSRFKGDDRPRENVTWYEAMAFCSWLSDKTKSNITLPTVHQWQRAARGDDDRLYPWGSEFNVERANTRESKIKMTTLVMRYEDGLSPFGIYDMAGNAWEWCLNSGEKDSRNQGGDSFRAIYGGSFISDYKRAQTNYHFNLSPEYHYATIGFRLVINP